MKKRIKHSRTGFSLQLSSSIRLFPLLLIIECALSQTQWALSSADSAVFASAKDNVQRLTQLVSQYQGKKLGAMAQNRLGILALKNKRLDTADQSFLATYRSYPGTAEASEATYYLGNIRNKQGRFDEASAYLKEFLNSNPTGHLAEWGRYYLVRAMSETKDPQFLESARQLLRSEHNLTKKNDATIQNELVRFDAMKQDFEAAISDALVLINKYPTSPYVHFVEGQIPNYYITLGNSRSAIDFCNNLISKYGPNTDDAARAQLTLATIAQNNNDFAKARTEYSKVGQLHSSAKERNVSAEYALAYLDVREGTVLNDSAKTAKGLEELESFITKYPKDHHVPLALMNIADLTANTQKYMDALAAYDRIIGFDTAFVVSGKMHRRSSDLIAHRALVVKAHLAKGILLMRLGKSSAALADFQAIILNNPHNNDALLYGARCYQNLGDKAAAKKLLDRVNGDDPGTKAAAEQLMKQL